MFPCFSEEVKTLVEEGNFDVLKDLHKSYQSIDMTREVLTSRLAEKEKENYLWYMCVEDKYNKNVNPETLRTLFPSSMFSEDGTPSGNLVRMYMLLNILKTNQSHPLVVEAIEVKIEETPRMWEIVESSRVLCEYIQRYITESKGYASTDVYRSLKEIGVFLCFSDDPLKGKEQLAIFDDIGYSDDFVKEVFYFALDLSWDMVYNISSNYLEDAGGKKRAYFNILLEFMRTHRINSHLEELYEPFEAFEMCH